MKTILINLAFLLFIAVAYWLDIFGLLATKGALVFAIVIVIGVFIAAIKILGNPLAGRGDDDDKDK